ncbi:MAG: RHS repeat-associated core domain-containing protein [Chitinophagales bacterium]
MDDLTYTYNTGNNTLQQVTDAVPNIEFGNDFNAKNGVANYSYSNGNLTGDSGKGLSFNEYSFLDQPQNISTDEGSIQLTYDALGRKLQKRVYDTGFIPTNSPECVGNDLVGQQDYLLDFVYRRYYPETDANGAPKSRAHRFYHEEGSIEWRRVDATNGGSQTPWEPTYQYTIADHLGNGRVYFTKDYDNDGLPDILQESHYYPFGHQIDGLSKLYDPPGGVIFSNNGYLYPEDPNTGYTTFIEQLQYTHDLKRYNGKEFNRELGLNWYDYGARWYDPVIGRWNAVDPLAEKFYGWSPFNYVYNNPLSFIDPDGRKIVIAGNSDFQSKVWKHMVSLAMNNETGFEQLKKAVESEKTLVIFAGDASVVRWGGNGDKTSGKEAYSTLAINFEEMAESKDGAAGSIEADLGHELSHFNMEIEGGLSKSKDGDSIVGVSPEEVPALEIENSIRKELGISERKSYSGHDFYGKELGNNEKYTGYYPKKKTGKYAPVKQGQCTKDERAEYLSKVRQYNRKNPKTYWRSGRKIKEIGNQRVYEW